MEYICRKEEIAKNKIKIATVRRRGPACGGKIKTTMYFFVVFFIIIFALPLQVLAADDDNDGLSNEEEVLQHTDVNNPDTDGDGYLDGAEVVNGFSPLKGDGVRMSQTDSDGDGLNDLLERRFGTDLQNKDSDGDGYSDYNEIFSGYSPTDKSPRRDFPPSVVVDKTSQTLAVYVNKLKLVEYPVSTGNPNFETPNGSYKVMRKVPVKRYTGPSYDYPGVKWNLEFKRGYYMHTAYWHDFFGKRTNSHGCVNMREADAEILYKYLPVGTTVSVLGKTPSKAYVGT